MDGIKSSEGMTSQHAIDDFIQIFCDVNFKKTFPIQAEGLHSNLKGVLDKICLPFFSMT